MKNGGAFHSYGTVYQRAPWLTVRKSFQGTFRFRNSSWRGPCSKAIDVCITGASGMVGWRSASYVRLDQRAAAALVRTGQVEHPGHLLGSPNVWEPALVEEGHNGLRAAYLRRCHPSLRFTRSAWKGLALAPSKTERHSFVASHGTGDCNVSPCRR